MVNGRLGKEGSTTIANVDGRPMRAPQPRPEHRRADASHPRAPEVDDPPFEPTIVLHLEPVSPKVAPPRPEPELPDELIGMYYAG